MHKEYFHKNIFDVYLDIPENEDSSMGKMQRLIREISGIKLSLSSSTLIDENLIKEGLIQGVYQEVLAFASVMRENRFDYKYLEYSENIYKKIILLSKESKAFKKDFENMFSVYQMNGDLTEILNLSKTKKNKLY